ncbi:DNA methylase [Gammaproteobacteria bacterium]|nr:DNA methylase [Gammaproteobacteria bacterium]
MTIQAVDLFCGAGGLTHGLFLAGINVTHGIDIDEDCRHPFEINNASTFIHKSITEITSNDLIGFFNKGHKNNSVRLLAGCAPCQPFSKYASTRKSTDYKWKLLAEFERLIYDTSPELITLENVPQLRTHPIFLDFIMTLEKLNYKIWWGIVNCSDYGLPQNRRRLVLLGSKLGDIELIPATDLNNKKTVRDAISFLPKIKAGAKNSVDPLHVSASLNQLNLKRISASKPGGNWQDWSSDLLAECHKRSSGGTYKSVYGRMEWDKPSPTMTTQCYGYGNGRFGHPEQDRAISLREAAILQAFPESYQFIKPNSRISMRKIGMLIGNAVPVTLGKIIGESFIHHMNQLKNISDESPDHIPQLNLLDKS